MIIVKGSRIILRNTRVPGVSCDFGVEVYCVKDNGDNSYIVSLDDKYIKSFKIEKHHIYKVYDLDNNLVYQHDRSDNL